MDTVFIDGSMGEGGGQVLRTSLALACITGKNLHIENIRATRRNPGLAKQHLSCVRAACEICGGKCTGAAIGSQVLDFQPGHICGGDFSFDIGSAGSATLVIQTILPALFLADNPSTVAVTGGTHNPWAPPFDFLAETFLPAIKTAGFNADCKLIKHGFFPAGGGKITLDVRPRHRIPNRLINFCSWHGLPAHENTDRACPKLAEGMAVPPENIQIYARIYTAKLPSHIAQRQKKLLLESKLKFRGIENMEVADSDGPGNCVMIRLVASSGGSLKAWPEQSRRAEGFGDGIPRTTVFTAFGQKGKLSEKVVDEVVSLAEGFLQSGAAIDRFLADQLLIYMAINSHFAKESEKGTHRQFAPAKAGGGYTTNDLTTHLTTNIETIKKFLPVDFTIEHEGKIHRISCKSV